MAVTARMTCNKNDGDDHYRTVGLHAVYSEDKSSPNYSFSQATPNAIVEMSITNPAAFNQFVVGKTYDITFTEYDGPN